MGMWDKVADFFGYVPIQEYGALLDEHIELEDAFNEHKTHTAGFDVLDQFVNHIGIAGIKVSNHEDLENGVLTSKFNLQYDLNRLIKVFKAMGFDISLNEAFDTSTEDSPAVIDHRTAEEFPAPEDMTPDPLTELTKHDDKVAKLNEAIDGNDYGNPPEPEKGPWNKRDMDFEDKES